MKIDTTYNFGDIVYLVTDPEQLERIVTGVTVKPSGVTYELSFAESCSNHYEIEISDTKDVMKTTTN